MVARFETMINLAAGRSQTVPEAFADLAPLANHHRLLAELAALYPGNHAASQMAFSAAIRELQLAGLQDQILALLAQKGLRAYPYKGPALARRLQSKNRQSRDVDILVYPGDFAVAASVVGESRPLVKGETPQVESFSSRFNRRKDCTFFDATANAAIELHWRMSLNFFRSSLETLVWQQLERRADISNGLLFCILAQHAATHGMSRLRWAADLVALNRLAPDAAQEAQAIAALHGTPVFVDAAIDFVSRILQVPIRHQAVCHPGETLSDMWAARLGANPFAFPDRWESHRTMLFGCPNTSARLDYIGGLIISRIRLATRST